MKKLFILLVLILPMLTHAQKMTVESFAFRPMDQTANLEENIHRDLNEDVGGLVKVMLAAQEATFEGMVLEQKLHSASEYWVFMAKGSKRLKVNVQGSIPLEINFADYGIEGIESRRTYVLTITMPPTSGAPRDDGLRYLVMTVTPANSKVLVDGKEQLVDNGDVVAALPRGSHSYEVSATGYATEKGTVQLQDEKKTLKIALKSVMATLKVECGTPGAQIHINGLQKGAAPWIGTLVAGTYKVEAMLDGYRMQSQNVTLTESEQRTITLPTLDMIMGSIDVKVTPVNADVFIDGKKVGTTPDVFRNVPVGSRIVEIRKEGYETLKKTVSVNENTLASLSGALKVGSSGNSANSASSIEKDVFTVNGVSFTMVRVDGGKFKMGATKEQGKDAESYEKPAHEVTLSAFSIGETEVTQALWQAVMGSNPSNFKDNPQNPVERVSWDDCQEFIKKLNSLTNKTFRLPTEAEWEYAARGGNKSMHYKYSGNKKIGDVAWFNDNSGSSSHPVKKKSPNELGLYDMSGNVYEWCEDYYDRYGSSAQSNPKGPSKGSFRVFRGGSWLSYARSCRVSYRYYDTPDSRFYSLGLRLAL